MVAKVTYDHGKRLPILGTEEIFADANHMRLLVYYEDEEKLDKLRYLASQGRDNRDYIYHKGIRLLPAQEYDELSKHRQSQWTRRPSNASE